MFKKKQTPTNPGRNVHRQTSANVFSYYNSRSPADNSYTRRSEQDSVQKKKISFKWVAYTPSIFAGLVLIACMVFVSTLTVTPKVRVADADSRHVLVGNPSSYEPEIRAIMERTLLNRSKLLIDTDKLAQDINESHPELGEIAVILPLVGRRPIVEIQPTEPAVVLVSANNTYVIDNSGRAVAFARDVESSVRDNLPVIQDESGVSLDRGKVVLTSDAVELITEVFGQLNAQKVPIQSMILPHTANELHVRIKDKPYFVKYDLRGEGKQQSGTFLAVKEHLEATNKVPAEYIDVRVQGKAFYK